MFQVFVLFILSREGGLDWIYTGYLAAPFIYLSIQEEKTSVTGSVYTKNITWPETSRVLCSGNVPHVIAQDGWRRDRRSNQSAL